jgi:hypothetical protein
MYDLTRPAKHPTRYFVAVSSDGQFTATRSSQNRLYSHATIEKKIRYGAEPNAYWHSRHDLGVKQLRQTKKYSLDYELVESKEVTPREFRQIKKQLIEKQKQSVSG